MKHRLAALAALVAVALSGCGVLDPATAGGPTAKAPSPTPSSTAGSGLGSVKDAGDLPDPCTLLTEAEVTDLTGRDITQVDEDGADAGGTTRYCQWQQESGQLAVFLSRTTAADFAVTVAEAKPVTGVGEDAYWHSGHLYVLHGTVQLDLYSRGGSDTANLADAKQVATVLLPRV